MNLQHLRTFLAAYRAGSISGGANALGVAQAAASAQVRSLETEIGKPLFERHARGVRPTAVAEELARAIGGGLDRAEAAFEGLRARSDELRGTVGIAGPAEFTGTTLPPVIASLARSGIDVRLRLGGREAIYGWLASGEADLAIVASEPDDPALAHEVIATERLVLVAGPSLGLHGPPSADWPWLAYDEGLPLVRSVLDAYDPRMAASVKAHIVVPSLTILRDLAIEGAGATVLPDYLCADAIGRGTLVRCDPDGPAPENALRLAWRREAMRHPRNQFARDHVRAVFG